MCRSNLLVAKEYNQPFKDVYDTVTHECMLAVIDVRVHKLMNTRCEAM